MTDAKAALAVRASSLPPGTWVFYRVLIGGGATKKEWFKRRVFTAQTLCHAAVSMAKIRHARRPIKAVRVIKPASESNRSTYYSMADCGALTFGEVCGNGDRLHIIT